MSTVTCPARPTSTPVALPSTALRFAGLAAGNFMIAMDATILNVAVPDLRHSLHAPAAALPWAIDAYTVVLAGLMLASGSIADRWGPRRIYQAALAGFAVFSVLCAAAPNVAVLIAGRALLGIPAAGLVPASMALLASLYPDGDARSRRIGLLVAITGLGIAAGPVLGGALVAFGGWRMVFLVNPPVAVLTLFAARRLADHRGGDPRPIDLPGLVLSIVGVTALTFGLISGGTDGWLRVPPLVALGVALVAVVALVFVERRVAAPALPAALLRLGRVRIDLAVAVTSQLVYYGLLFALAQWMVQSHGLSSFQTGMAFLPMTVPVAFVPVLTGRLVVRYGTRRVMLAGMALDLLGGATLAFGGTSLWTVFAAMVLVGVGSPLAIPSCIVDMSTAAPLSLAATAQGALNTFRQSGTALGIAIFASVSQLATTGIILIAVAVLTILAIIWQELPFGRS